MNNRFSRLYDNMEDLNTWNRQIVDTIHESALQIAGKSKRTRESKLIAQNN